jgi:Putative TM nitroreductase
METGQPITEIIKQRYSCRVYLETPLDPAALAKLAEYAAACTRGPLGNAARFEIAAALNAQMDLKGLGTYGTIKSPGGFIIGAQKPAENSLEDYGYLMEQIILKATALNLGTCWLGGFFNRSAFAKKMALQPDEIMPAVSALGMTGARPGQKVGFIPSNAAGANRLPWQQLFYEIPSHTPLTPEAAGEFATALEMVRLGPSASNKQPWRIVRQNNDFHFYLARTPGYHSRAFKLFDIPDLQRIDIGIAMCHFEMSAAEAGLQGKWVFQPPSSSLADVIPWKKLAEYRITYQGNPT